MKKFFLISLAALLAFASCQRHYAIEDRARQQIMVSMNDELNSFDPASTENGWRMEGLKTVYVNDSICILQCTVRWRDAQNEKKVRDYRYIYLLNMDLSQAARKNVFCEEFRNTLCMPDEVIEESRKEVKKNRENVYDQFASEGLPVRAPFDAQTE